MTTEERVAVVENQVKQNRASLERIEGKVDQLIAASNMGKGAWWALMRVGGLMLLVAGAVAWMWDHVPKPWGHP